MWVRDAVVDTCATNPVPQRTSWLRPWCYCAWNTWRVTHRTTADLEAHIHVLRDAPISVGTLEFLVRRPAENERDILDQGQLDVDAGLIGDNWMSRATSYAIAEGRHLKAQLNVMSARMITFLADSRQDRARAGDQLFVDLYISAANLPVGSRLAIGPDAVIEVTDKPHNGCAKFRARFGEEALAFVNSPIGKEPRLRGFNARVVASGVVRLGDKVTKL
jgi:hypothetical protein